jgi:methylase of polypeptide subunit release factors
MTAPLTLRAAGQEIRLEPSDRIPPPDASAQGMANLLFVARSKRVLDLAGGTGFFGIAAARIGAEEVWMGDPDPAAVEAARRNVDLNEVEMHCKAGEGFDAFRGRVFDLIIADPPQMPAPEGGEGPAFGGRDGLAGFEPLLREAPRHLDRGGELLTRLSSLAATDRFESMLGRRFKFRNFPNVRREYGTDELNMLHPGMVDHLLSLRREKRADFEEASGKIVVQVRYYMAMIK